MTKLPRNPLRSQMNTFPPQLRFASRAFSAAPDLFALLECKYLMAFGPLCIVRHINGGFIKQYRATVKKPTINKLKVNNPPLSYRIASNPTVKTSTGSYPAVKTPRVNNPRANKIIVSYPKAINPRVSYFGIVEYIIYNELIISPKGRR